MSDFKAIILCNNPIAIPAIKEFLFYGKVGAIVVTKQHSEMQYLLQQLLTGTGVPLLLVDRKNCMQVLAESIRQYEITVGLTITFPFILKKEIIEMVPKGFINFHFGLLPQCRGPQPILWHIINNDAEAGITLHRIDEGIDTGPIVLQEKMAIRPTDTYGIVQSNMGYLGAKAAATLFKILSYGSSIPAVPQDESKAMYYKNPTAADLTIDWKTMSADKIIRIVNACNPWNKAAGTSINNWTLGITEAKIVSKNILQNITPGSILAVNETDGLLVQAVNNEVVKINIIYTQEGFLSGCRLADFNIQPGNCFN